MRTKRYLQNHVVYQRTEMILRYPLASPVRGARQNGLRLCSDLEQQRWKG